MGILVEAFGGEQPKVDAALLPGNYASLCENAWLYSGALIGHPRPVNIHTLGRPDIGKVYRIPKFYNSPADFSQSYWLEFESFNTDVVRSPVFGETFDRYYSASEHRPPLYNTVERIAADLPAFLLGIPAPGTPPVVTAEDGTSDIQVSRAYVYTYVSEYKEEGPPSPPELVNGDAGDTWKIRIREPSTVEQGERRNLTHARLYRTVPSTSTTPDYYFVEELPLTGTGGFLPWFTDPYNDAQITGRAILQSTKWAEPPDDLEGFTMMPNGILASWRGSEMWFSEPYRPHAWPAEYVRLTEYPIVGMGVWQQSLVVCTQGFPVVAFGSHPSTITTTKQSLFEPCTSRGSIMSAPEGVYYASASGLVLVSTAAQVLTTPLIMKGQFQNLHEPKTFRAARMSTGYYGSNAVTTGAFDEGGFEVPDAFQPTDLTGARNGFLFDISDARLALTRLKSESDIYGLQNDPWTDELFILRDGAVWHLDVADESILTIPAKWQSKLFQTEKPRNYQAMKVYFTVPPGTPPPPATRLEVPLGTDMTLSNRYGVIRFYCDEPAENTLLAAFELRTSGELLRLPGDRKYDYCYFQLETRVRVRRVMIAETVKELGAA